MTALVPSRRSAAHRRARAEVEDSYRDVVFTGRPHLAAMPASSAVQVLVRRIAFIVQDVFHVGQAAILAVAEQAAF